jgi:putative thiamine transport system substrate-binding protein
MIARRAFLASAAALPFAAKAATPDHPLLRRPWADVVAAARGQTVFWNAWGGDDRTNGFIAWANDRISERYGIRVQHVRLRDTAEAVARVVAEKAAGRTEGGSVDLIWINGPNFLAMKDAGLLFGPFVDRLPNARLIDREGKPATVTDFTVPVDGLASPWRMAQIVYVYDSATVRDPPRTIPAMLAWARANPGRLAHPTVRNFLGATFLKQALYALTPDPSLLAKPVADDGFGPATAPLWAWYDALRPHLWRQGRQFPENGPAQRTLMNDGEIDIMISFNPSEASTAIANGQLPPSVRTYVLEGGTIGNVSFVAIPFNAAHAAAAMVLADFLLSPEAQAHGQDPRVMGNFTVLALDRLAPEDRARFERLPRGAATLTNAELGRPLPEPHPSWMTRITAEWERRVSR